MPQMRLRKTVWMNNIFSGRMSINAESILASRSEGGGPQGRRECPIKSSTLPQSKTGSWEPFFASPLIEGAKAAFLHFYL